MTSNARLFVLIFSWLTELNVAASLHFDVAAAKEHPVSKVVELLQNMKKHLEEEADADEAVYEKLACWCQRNDKEKTKAIADAEARIQDLDAKVEQMAALSQELQVNIAALEKEVAADQKSLATATASREKAAAEFVGEEKEMIESIRALQAALVVIGKHHEGKSASFLNNKAVSKAYATALALMKKHSELLQGVITPKQRRALGSFVQGEGSQPTHLQAYTPQSGEIFGILKQMKETFEADLSSAQKEEIAAQEEFADLKKAKETEIQVGQESIEAKKQQLASTDQTLAQSKEDREDTAASLSADKKFLTEVRVKCKMTDTEWEKRQSLRQSELTAVAKAIEILSADEARAQFSKTFNPSSFLQMRQEKDFRAEALQVLSKIARKHPKLAAIKTAVRLDTFPRVKKAIDDMVASLLKEKADEIAEKKLCTQEFFSNKKSTAEKIHTKGRLDHKIISLEQSVKERKAAIETLDKEIEELNATRIQASQDRTAEKEEFDLLVADQKKTQELLHQALTVLKEVYSSEPQLLQQSPTFAPDGFDEYKQNRASAGIIAMIEQIVTDTELMTKEAEKSEQNAIDTYAKFVQTTNEAISVKQDAKVDLEAQKAQADTDLTATKTERQGTADEIEALAKSAGDLHTRCDFLLKNFEVIQKARDEEVEALRQAKAFLSGMQQQ